MKLLRVGPVGLEKPALLDADGILRDLSNEISDIDADALSCAGLDSLRAIDTSTLPIIDASERIGPCVAHPRNFICIGLNYEDHAIESNLDIPEEPVIFLKSLSSISGPQDNIIIPRGSIKTDWEVELAVIIGSVARNIPRESAFSYIAGYCVSNDISERDFQFSRGGTWDKGKGCDTFGPIGPWLVTKDEVPDPQNLDIWLDVDGKRMQSGNTRTMIFPIDQIVSYVSKFITLYPGDIISTGTPPGVGMGQSPEPVYLRPGQTMTLGVEGLGVQKTCSVSEEN